ncbi:unnamed protein product [Euphydryas editha]|uniref:Gustatory receptor n=1 Tax=Euphydryas editha TaxID=104508 RepID=A0AAU9U7U4_EUPED|nr:unnamed protein product [Euphydryas editha]
MTIIFFKSNKSISKILKVFFIILQIITLSDFGFLRYKLKLVSLKKCIRDKKLKPSEAQFFYKYLNDSVANVRKTFDPIVVVTLSANIPCMMITIYETIRDLKTEVENLYENLVNSIIVIVTFVTIVAPMIAAESSSTEVDKIKIILHDMLLCEKDDRQVRDVKKFIQYIDARPFKFRVLKIIPIDATFPVLMFNFCVTYLIVILQLTHIY